MILSMLFAIVSAQPVHGANLVKVDGSSTVFPITEAIAEEFQGAEKGATRVTVGVSGTGGGFKKFCRGETDVQDASRPISTSEMQDCKKANVTYLELPIAFDAIVVAVHAKNTWLKDITVADLKKVWEPAAQGKITSWDQVNVKWPKGKMKLYGAGSDSGTFDFFTEAIVGKAKSSRGDYTASEDDNTLVTGIAGDEFSMGYIPMAYYEANKAKMKAIGVIAPTAKTAVLPSRESVEASTYYLARPVFIYVSAKSLARPEVKKFVEFYLKNAATVVPEVKYVPLPAKAYEMGREHLGKMKLGTVFGGKEAIGLKIEELLKRETTM
jgi:phosphate transport system substrate-binding protein